ncbi:MAG: hypothetical protein ACI8ZW_001586, partial [Yoonia sp.]
MKSANTAIQKIEGAILAYKPGTISLETKKAPG